jgi:hypothetical protein
MEDVQGFPSSSPAQSLDGTMVMSCHVVLKEDDATLQQLWLF